MGRVNTGCECACSATPDSCRPRPSLLHVHTDALPRHRLKLSWRMLTHIAMSDAFGDPCF